MTARLFGAFEIEVPGQPSPPWRLPRQRWAWVLAYLLLHPELHPRERLSEAFWPEGDPFRARRSLSTAIWELRRALDAVIPSGQLLTITAEAIGIRPEAAATTDAAAFRRLLAAGDDRAAISLYRGDLLDGCDDAWVGAEREHYRLRVTRALRAETLRARDRGDFARWRDLGERLAAFDPLDEATARLLIEAHYRLGDRAAAAAVFGRLRRALKDELDVAPEAETLALWQEVRREPMRPLTQAPLRVPLVGREPELAWLAGLWHEASGAHGIVTLLIGEAGAGKTRLGEELAAIARRRGGRVLIGRSAEFGQETPYQPLIEALRGDTEGLINLPTIWGAELSRLLPELGERFPPPLAVSPEREQGRLFEALARAVAHLAAQAPLLLILEDLHWAGESTLAALHHIARRHDDKMPCLLLWTARTVELAAAPRLAELVAVLARELDLKRLALDPLRPDAVRRLVDHFLPDAWDHEALSAELFATSGGNPFFLVQLLRAYREGGPAVLLHDGLPPRARDAVLARLARLSSLARTVLNAAAVAGERFDLETVATALDLPLAAALDAADELLAAAMIREAAEPDRPAYRFSHALVRQAVYAELSQGRRVLLHGRIGEALERLRAEALPEIAADMAHHALAAGDKRRAARFLILAGERAATTRAFAEAVRHYDHALELLADGDADPAILGAVRAARGDMLARLGRISAALADYDVALALARARGDRPMELLVLLASGMLRAGPLGYGDVRETLEAALRLARDLGDVPSQIDALNRLGNVLINSENPTLAREYHAEALTLARASGDEWRLADTLDHFGLLSELTLDVAACLNAYEETIQIRRKLGDPAGTIWPLNELGFLHIHLGHFDQAHAFIQRAIEICREVGDRLTEPIVLIQATYVALEAGRWEELTLADRALEIARESDHQLWIAATTATLARRAAELGDVAAAHAYAHEAMSRGRQLGSAPWLVRLQAIMWPAQRHIHTLNLASDLQDVVDAAAARGFHSDEALLLPAVIAAWSADGDHGRAEAAVRRLAALARQGHFATLMAQALLLAGLVARDHDDRPRAERRLANALRGAERVGARHLTWQIAAELSQVSSDPTVRDRSRDLARATVADLAARLTDPAWRASFLARPDVAAIMR